MCVFWLGLTSTMMHNRCGAGWLGGAYATDVYKLTRARGCRYGGVGMCCCAVGSLVAQALRAREDAWTALRARVGREAAAAGAERWRRWALAVTRRWVMRRVLRARLAARVRAQRMGALQASRAMLLQSIASVGGQMEKAAAAGGGGQRGGSGEEGVNPASQHPRRRRHAATNQRRARSQRLHASGQVARRTPSMLAPLHVV